MSNVTERFLGLSCSVLKHAAHPSQQRSTIVLTSFFFLSFFLLVCLLACLLCDCECSYIVLIHARDVGVGRGTQCQDCRSQEGHDGPCPYK